MRDCFLLSTIFTKKVKIYSFRGKENSNRLANWSSSTTEADRLTGEREVKFDSQTIDNEEPVLICSVCRTECTSREQF